MLRTISCAVWHHSHCIMHTESQMVCPYWGFLWCLTSTHSSANSTLTCHLGARHSWDQRLLRWLAGLWRPAPYAYLDQSSATTYQHTQHPPPSAYHVTEGAALDHQLVHAHSSTADSAGPTTSSGHSPAVINAAQSSEQAAASQDPPASSSHEEQEQLQPAGSRHFAEAGPGVEPGRHSNSRWQWLRSGWGSQQRRASAASRSRKDQRQHTVDQRELLRNIKAVVPQLSDDVILAELARTVDANQAVENLLSGM